MLIQAYQQQYIELAQAQGVLRFGQFTLKSGRVSPYFHDMGRIDNGAAFLALGGIYADAILDHGYEFDVLFGPAYKGIPLVVSCAMALAKRTGQDVPFCFDRKEVKDYGEGGQLVGAPLEGRVLLLDDVITAGTAYRQARSLIQAHGAELSGLLVALDRQEVGDSGQSALDAIREQDGVMAKAVITLDDLIAHLKSEGANALDLDAMLSYRQRYGVEAVQVK